MKYTKLCKLVKILCLLLVEALTDLLKKRARSINKLIIMNCKLAVSVQALANLQVVTISYTHDMVEGICEVYDNAIYRKSSK